MLKSQDLYVCILCNFSVTTYYSAIKKFQKFYHLVGNAQVVILHRLKNNKCFIVVSCSSVPSKKDRVH